MKLHAMGIGYRHDENFRIFRPEGSGDNLLVIFRTPAFAVVGNAGGASGGFCGAV